VARSCAVGGASQRSSYRHDANQVISERAAERFHEMSTIRDPRRDRSRGIQHVLRSDAIEKRAHKGDIVDSRLARWRRQPARDGPATAIALRKYHREAVRIRNVRQMGDVGHPLRGHRPAVKCDDHRGRLEPSGCRRQKVLLTPPDSIAPETSDPFGADGEATAGRDGGGPPEPEIEAVAELRAPGDAPPHASDATAITRASAANRSGAVFISGSLGVALRIARETCETAALPLSYVGADQE
jgi:hypothetical protein